MTKQDTAQSWDPVQSDDLAQPEVQQSNSATPQIKYAFTRSQILETYEKGPEAVVELVETLVSENNAMYELVQNTKYLATRMAELEQTINQLYRDRGQLPPAHGFGKHAKRSRPKK